MLGQVSGAFSSSDTITLDGLLNIWASCSGVLFSAYLIVYSVKEQFKLSINIGDINKMLILSCLAVSPLMAIGIYSKTKENVSGYVECTGERKASSRYSSRTYAVSQQLCIEIGDR